MAPASAVRWRRDAPRRTLRARFLVIRNRHTEEWHVEAHGRASSDHQRDSRCLRQRSVEARPVLRHRGRFLRRRDRRPRWSIAFSTRRGNPPAAEDLVKPSGGGVFLIDGWWIRSTTPTAAAKRRCASDDRQGNAAPQTAGAAPYRPNQGGFCRWLRVVSWFSLEDHPQAEPELPLVDALAAEILDAGDRHELLVSDEVVG